MRFRRRGVEAKLIVLDQGQPAAAPDANLVKALAHADEWFGRIVQGKADGVGDIASAERLCRTRVTRVLSACAEITMRYCRGGSRRS